MAIVAIPGKVYLRDTRNGNLYEFERSLSEMTFIEQVVLVPAEPEPEQPKPDPEEGEELSKVDPEPVAAPATPPKPPKGK